MYPGRLNHILYVHLLDCEVREEKLNTRTRPMTVGPEVDVRVISVSFLGHFLINNPLFSLRLKDVLGQRSQHSTRKPPYASPQHTAKNTIPIHCCYLGPT